MQERLDLLDKEIRQKMVKAETQMREHVDILVAEVRTDMSRQGHSRVEQVKVGVDNSSRPSPDNGALDRALLEMQQQFKDVDSAHAKLSKDINSIQAWLEASFPLSVVRASRVAILSLDLTAPERQTALSQLESKEKMLTAEMEKLT